MRTKLCARCHITMTVTADAKGPKLAWCRDCRAAYQAEYRRLGPAGPARRPRKTQPPIQGPPRPPRPPLDSDEDRVCVICCRWFERWQDWPRPGAANAQCKDCYLAITRTRQRVDGPLHGPPRPSMESLREQTIAYETHCAICGLEVDKTITQGRNRPSIDHRIPKSLGGALYDPSNLRLTHLGCNSSHHHKLLDALRIYEQERHAVAALALRLVDAGF